MKALIIYKDLASAAEVNIILQHSAHNVNFVVQWSIRPWRMDMLRFPPSAEAALTDARDAHLIVFAGCCAQSFPFWLEHWLKHWAKCRQIEDAALALFCEGNADTPSMSAILELSQFATRHGLSFIFDEKMAVSPASIEVGSWLIRNRLIGRDSKTLQTLDPKTGDTSCG